jgi:hypothetical protein
MDCGFDDSHIRRRQAAGRRGARHRGDRCHLRCQRKRGACCRHQHVGGDVDVRRTRPSRHRCLFRPPLHISIPAHIPGPVKARPTRNHVWQSPAVSPTLSRVEPQAALLLRLPRAFPLLRPPQPFLSPCTSVAPSAAVPRGPALLRLHQPFPPRTHTQRKERSRLICV